MTMPAPLRSVKSPHPCRIQAIIRIGFATRAHVFEIHRDVLVASHLLAAFRGLAWQCRDDVAAIS
jgi:hypothetical protein